MAHGVIHWEIGTRDGSRLRKFYEELFEWKVTPSGPGYALVAGSDGGIGGGIMDVGEDILPYLTFYVQVDDVKTALARSIELGATELVPPTPIAGIGQFAIFKDPDEHMIGLLEPAAGS